MAVALVAGIYLAKEAIMVFIVSLIIASALESTVSRLEKWRIHRILGTIIVFLFLFALLAFVVYMVVPLAVSEFSLLLTNLSGLTAQFTNFKLPLNLPEVATNGLSNTINAFISGNVSFFDVFGRIIGGLIYAVSTIIIAFYLTAARDGTERFFRAVLPSDMEERVVSLYKRTRERISRWAEAQLLLGLLMGLIVFIGLYLIGVKYSLLLGIVAGILEIMPVIGPIFSGAFAVLAALSTSLTMGVYTLIFFFAAEQVESNILVPLLMKRAVQIHPALIVLSLLAGYEIFGYVGIIIAVPAAAFFGELVTDQAKRKNSSKEASLLS